jgi:hypothetical protein
MKLGPVLRLIVSGVLVLSVLLVVMSVRAWFEARALASQGEAAAQANQLDQAIVWLRLAARWDAPFNSPAERAFDALERIGSAAEARGDSARALAAYRAIHAAAMATRGFYLPKSERLERIDPRIERLRRLLAEQGESKAGLSALTSPSQYLSALRPHRPRPLGVLVAWAGFAAWVGGASVFLRRGVDAQGRLVRKVARQGALFALLGWIAFALGLRIA